jgi:hypothetical protein
MENLARAHHAAFLIFQEDRNTATARRACEKFPFYRKGRSVINYNGRFYEADSEQYYATRDYVNRGFLFISIPITEPDHTVGENDCHLNVRGNRQVLRDLSRAMMKSNQIEIQGGSRARIDD